MSLDNSFKSLLNEKNIDGVIELNHALSLHVDEEKLDSIMQQILIKNNDLQREGGSGFSPRFTFTELEEGLQLNYHRPMVDNDGPGEVYGTIDLVQYKHKDGRYFLLKIDSKSWETLRKEEYHDLTMTRLKAHVALLGAYLDIMENSLLSGIVNTYARVTASQRRHYTYNLTLGENFVLVRQIRNGKVVSEYNLYVNVKPIQG